MLTDGIRPIKYNINNEVLVFLFFTVLKGKVLPDFPKNWLQVTCCN